jgi:hypothetical protein
MSQSPLRPHIGGRAGLLALAAGLAPVASAVHLPPNPVAHPIVPPPLPGPVPAHLPGWIIVAMIASTMVLSVATTLATLSLLRRRDQRSPAADADPVAGPATAPSLGAQSGPADILVSGFRRRQ